MLPTHLAILWVTGSPSFPSLTTGRIRNCYTWQTIWKDWQECLILKKRTLKHSSSSSFQIDSFRSTLTSIAILNCMLIIHPILNILRTLCNLFSSFNRNSSLFLSLVCHDVHPINRIKNTKTTIWKITTNEHPLSSSVFEVSPLPSSVAQRPTD